MDSRAGEKSGEGRGERGERKRERERDIKEGKSPEGTGRDLILIVPGFIQYYVRKYAHS